MNAHGVDGYFPILKYAYIWKKSVKNLKVWKVCYGNKMLLWNREKVESSKEHKRVDANTNAISDM